MIDASLAAVTAASNIFLARERKSPDHIACVGGVFILNPLAATARHPVAADKILIVVAARARCCRTFRVRVFFASAFFA